MGSSQINPEVLRIAIRVRKDIQDDVVQDLWVKGWWIPRGAVGPKTAEMARKYEAQKYPREYVERVEGRGVVDPVEEVMRREEIEIVRNSLPEMYYRMMIGVVEGTLKEVAEEYGVSRGTARNRAKEGMDMVRRERSLREEVVREGAGEARGQVVPGHDGKVRAEGEHEDGEGSQ
jgi:DNA-directed RNA polymerase specialized sigma24 family protein